MDMQSCNPFVRFARFQEERIPQGFSRAVDHRIFYCHSGNGSLEAEGELFAFAPGTLLYIPAGTAYRYLFAQEIPVFSGCNFDFSQDHNALVTPIPPVRAEDFGGQKILEVLPEGSIFSHCIYLEEQFRLEPMFVEIAKEFVGHSMYYEAKCSALLKEVLIAAARVVLARQQGVNESAVNDIVQYIHSHYDRPLSNKEIAARFHYHEHYASTLMLKHTGLTLHQYVLNHKMHMAVQLLQSTTLSIGEVAEKVGMPDIKHFSKCFKNIIGHPPSKFKVK